MAKENTRIALIEAGIKLITEKGFNNTGIGAILKEVGVPKGSFYHYFSSKEDFGMQMIDHFVKTHFTKVDNCLKNKDLSPIQRLRCYYKMGFDYMVSQQCHGGCLIGNLSQELADQNEHFRKRLEKVFTCWQDRISFCFKEAQEQQEINSKFDADTLAEFYLIIVEGATLRCKLTKSTKPMQKAMEIFFEKFLGISL